MNVLCAGMTTLDLVAAISEQAEADSETRALWSAAVIGGPIGRGAITAARLGATTELVSMIGTGPFAELLRQTLKPEPLTPGFITDKDAVTSQHSLVTLCGAHRTIVWTPQPRGTKEYIEYAISKITPKTILLTDCSDAPAHAAIAAAIDTCGAGDVFHGAFAFALASGRPIPGAITLAARTAAQKCTAFGNEGIPGAA